MKRSCEFPSRHGSVVVAVFLLGSAGCRSSTSGRAAAPLDAHGDADGDATADTNADATADVIADARSSDGDSATPSLLWTGSPPPVEGDGRIVDVGDTLNGLGWDTCAASPIMTVSEPGALPPAIRGQAYLLSTNTPLFGVAKPPHIAQAYFFPESRPTGAVGPPQGLWFDLALVSGSAAGATVALYETDTACVVQRSLGTFSLAAALVQPGHWRTACLDLAGPGDLANIGVRIDATAGVLGFDALRFGGPCR
jgi:hypothetical protein